MFEQKAKVGPKGQVVIPWKMRKALKLSSGSKVVFKLVGKKLTLEGYS